jgi:hypothetical protein
MNQHGSTKKSRSLVRSPLTLPKASLLASTLSVVLAGLPSAARAADDAVAPADIGNTRRRSPNLILGGGVGYANHWGKSYEVDTVTGASTPVNSFSERGVAMNAFADFAAFDLGPGNLGLTTGFTLALPKTFMNFELEPRYRLRFPLMGTTLRSVEPWAGLGVAFAFREKIDKNYYLWFRVSAGCDLALGSDRLYAGIAVNYDMGNPRGVTRTTYEDHMNSFAVLLRLSYRVF